MDPDRCPICMKTVSDDDVFRCMVGSSIYHRSCITATLNMRIDEINGTTTLDQVIRLAHKVNMLEGRIGS